MATKTKENNNNNSSLFPITAHFTGDLTEVINKAYNDITAPFKYIGNGLAFTISYITCQPKLKMFKTIETTKQEMIDFSLNLKHKHDKIPEENVVMPRMSILGPATDILQYNFDETEIKVMFINLLTNEMDNRKQSKVLPAYTEIIKQISKDDAIFLGSLNSLNKKQVSLFSLRANTINKKFNGYKDLGVSIIVDRKNGCLHTIEPKSIVLDNLKRLNIIKIDHTSNIPDNNNLIESAFNSVKNKYKIDETDYILGYESGILEITDFGENFIDICCS